MENDDDDGDDDNKINFGDSNDYDDDDDDPLDPWSADTSNFVGGTQIFISGIILRAGWPFRGGMRSCYENQNDDDGDDVGWTKGH